MVSTAEKEMNTEVYTLIMLMYKGIIGEKTRKDVKNLKASLRKSLTARGDKKK